MSAARGRFWIDSGTGASAGTLTADDDGYTLDVERQIGATETVTVTETRHERVTSISADEAAQVRDYRQRVVFGELDDGTPLTLLDAQTPGGIVGDSQEFRGYRWISGAHVDSLDVVARAVRIYFNAAPGWGDQDEVTTASGLVRPIPAESGALELVLNEPAPIRELVQVRDALTNLMVLWTRDKKVGLLRTDLDILPDGWCTYGFARERTSTYWGSDLLPHQHLTLERVARWIDLAQTLGPLPFMATADANILQLDARTFAAALEGLHLRLHEKQRMIPGASKSAIDKASKTAAEAAVARLQDSVSELARETAYERYRRTLGHVADPTYAERLQELVEAYGDIAPGLLGPDPSAWIRDMTRIRNNESHQALPTNTFGEAEISKYLVYASSARWFLRICLLSTLADRALLTEALRESSSFNFALANIDSEPTWGSYSALDTFRSALA